MQKPIKGKKKLLDQVREIMRRQHYSIIHDDLYSRSEIEDIGAGYITFSCKKKLNHFSLSRESEKHRQNIVVEIYNKCCNIVQIMKTLDITRSRLRSRLLSYFFTNPQAKLHLREIAIRLGEDAGNLCKELKRLSEEGLFYAETIGRQKFFFLNKNYPLYTEIKSIVSKTVGVQAKLVKMFESNKAIFFAFIYGSFTSGAFSLLSDIDVMLIIKGDGFDEGEILQEAARQGRAIERDINITYFPLREWKEKVSDGDSFVREVLAGKKIMLKGDEEDLRGLSS